MQIFIYKVLKFWIFQITFILVQNIAGTLTNFVKYLKCTLCMYSSPNIIYFIFKLIKIQSQNYFVKGHKLLPLMIISIGFEKLASIPMYILVMLVWFIPCTLVALHRECG